MPTLFTSPSIIESAGNIPKYIEEFIGRVNSKTETLSIALMKSPAGWIEPGQTPEFDEYTLVLDGLVRVESKNGITDAQAGQAVLCPRGEWIRYSTPGEEGAEYVSVCIPAFSPETVHRDE